MRIPEVAALRPRLLPEMTVFSADSAEQGTIYVGGVADALAFDEGNNVDVVVDWKSDVDPSAAVIDALSRAGARLPCRDRREGGPAGVCNERPS